MKILFLHDLMPLTQLRRQTVNQSFFFLKYRPATEAVFHAVGDPIDDALKSGDFDAIFLDASFLCWRWAGPAAVFEAFLSDYAWLATHPAVKIAFPQDDYDRQAVLDDWMAAWNIDVIFTPLPDFAQVLYPKAARTARIRPFLTGFVDDVDLAIAAQGQRPISERPLDVVYRARPLPANFGELGRLKTRIAEAFGPACRRAGLREDISTAPGDTIFGDGWLKFLGSARYVLGTPSGSSVIDARGEIGAAVSAYQASHPQATFDEVTQACVPPAASRHRMEAISPRVFETALARSCQILVRGAYGPLEAGRHYIPVEPDLSNVDAVVAGLADHQRAQRIADDCYDLVSSAPDLHYRQAATLVETVIREVWQLRGDRAPSHGMEAPGAVSTADAIERLLRSQLGDRQRLLHGLAGDLAQQTTGDAIAPSRFYDLGRSVGDRWGRLARHAGEERSRGDAFEASAAEAIRQAGEERNRAIEAAAQAEDMRGRAEEARGELAALRGASAAALAVMVAKRFVRRYWPRS